MMKLKYSICCGLDVHKNVIVATIVTTNSQGISEYLQKSFSTINSDIQKFHDWLIENNCYHVCMESTGKYWIPILIISKTTLRCVLHTLNTSKPSKARRLIKRIPNGSLTFINSIWSDAPLFLRRIFASLENSQDTASNWCV